ncbi:hypothetical protein EST38_g13927 [Candolleomyces aberdarensis]|uniref:Uncharacterized protein n=1 Tax=Candolleomyces aberdarensis TaxID=2316362 RepID=A0A4V1Q1K7_9AGAR|nr:hypothetical protein EST38_g13927 [Candolleomyces aberdarensis]
MYWPIWNAQTETNSNDSAVNTGNGNLFLDLPSMDYSPEVGSSFNSDIGLSQFPDAVNPGPLAPGQVDAAPGAPSEPELVSIPVINATRPNPKLPSGGLSDFTDSLETWSPQRLQQPPIWRDSTLPETSFLSAPLDTWQQVETAGPSSAAPTLDVAQVPQASSSAHLDLAGPSRETAVWQHSTLPANSCSSPASVTDAQQTEAGPPAESSLDEANPTQDDSPRPTQPHPAFVFDPEFLASFSIFPSEPVAPSTMDHTSFGVCNNFDWMEPSVENNNQLNVLNSQNPQPFLTPQPVVNDAQSPSGPSFHGMTMASPAMGNIHLPQSLQPGPQTASGPNSVFSQSGMGPSGYGAPTLYGSPFRMRALAPASMANAQRRQFVPQIANGAHNSDFRSQTYLMGQSGYDVLLNGSSSRTGVAVPVGNLNVQAGALFRWLPPEYHRRPCIVLNLVEFPNALNLP